MRHGCKAVQHLHLEGQKRCDDGEVGGDVPSDVLDAGLLSIGERLDNDAERRCVPWEDVATAADIIVDDAIKETRDPAKPSARSGLATKRVEGDPGYLRRQDLLVGTGRDSRAAIGNSVGKMACWNCGMRSQSSFLTMGIPLNLQLFLLTKTSFTLDPFRPGRVHYQS